MNHPVIHHFPVSKERSGHSLFFFIALLIFLKANYTNAQTTQSFFHTQVQRGMVKSSLGTSTQYNPQSTGSFYVGNAAFDQTNRGYIVFNISSIPGNATITAATLNLKPIASTGNTSSSTSTILFKNLVNRPTNFNSAEDWTLLNGASQFTSLIATVNSPLIISTVDLKNKVQSSRAEGFFYFGLVNASEPSKGLSFSTANTDLFLSITYTIPVPAAPTSLQASNITTSGCTLAWTKPAGTVTGYRIYRNDVLYQSVTTLTGAVTGLAANTSYSFKVSAYNIGGESPKSSPIAVLTLPNPVAPIGATFSNPINIGNLGICSSYGHGADIGPGTNYGNEFGNNTADVYYKFNLTTAGNVSLSNCKPDGISGSLYLLNASGNYVSGGVFGPACDVGYDVNYTLQPGVYYVVSEGVEGSSLTWLTMQIYVNPILNTSPNVTIPAGSATTLSASGSAATYSWSPSTGLSSTMGASVIASPTVSTFYTVTARATNGCTVWGHVQVTVSGAVGSTFTNPIVANIGGCGFNSGSLNTTGYGNEYGSPSEDIYFKFTVSTASVVSFDANASDAARIVLLSSSGSFLDQQYYDYMDSGDDAGTRVWGPVDGTYLTPTLQPGIYYLVAEGTDRNVRISVGIQTPAGYSCRKAVPVIKGSPASDSIVIADEEIENIEPRRSSPDVVKGEIFPNPASSYVSVSMRADFQGVVQILNSNGTKVKETFTDQSKGIDITDLPVGLYMVKIIQDGKMRVERLLVRR
ncbi:MAG: T9SS type A sorting domain-containing protein [Chryseolinea sp.]